MSAMFKTACADVVMEEGGIVYVNNFSIEASLEETKAHIQSLRENFGSELPLLVLSDIRRLKKTNKAVRDYYASDEVAEVTKSLAILSGSGLSKIVGNLFLKFSSPKFPTKIFTKKEKAIEWLLQQP